MTTKVGSPSGKADNAGNSGKASQPALTGRPIAFGLILLNAIALLIMISWLYFDRSATKQPVPFLHKVRWWTHDLGGYVPLIVGRTESAASEGAAIVGYFFAFLTMILSVGTFYLMRPRERLVLSFFSLILGIAWVIIGANWDYIRLRGQSVSLAHYCNAVSSFAEQLDNSWPEQGGVIDNFGAFLSYPYGEPRTLLILGGATIPDTPLQISAIERTPGEAIRFQLSGDAPDVWFEWRIDDSAPKEFQGGLQQSHIPGTQYKIAHHLYVVRYEINEHHRNRPFPKILKTHSL